MKFIVDSREHNSGIPSMLSAMGIEYQMAEMPAGDYQICDTLVERKSVDDLAASILDGRLFGQMEAICALTSKPILLIEGNLANVVSQMHEDALPGAISALALYWDVSFVATPDKRGTARLLGRLWHHSVNGLGYEVPRVGKVKAKPGSEGAAALYLLEGGPLALKERVS
ncbi:MAG: ERCC4 domain-containing protein [Burkholderiaceae bacterium]|nr:ERCC4 domain-containing protein [Burkholderiaceae bacterium]MDP3137337.1 ERCC4 domain-containing protein [Burkholderiaceae bacterium]